MHSFTTSASHQSRAPPTESHRSHSHSPTGLCCSRSRSCSSSSHSLTSTIPQNRSIPMLARFHHRGLAHLIGQLAQGLIGQLDPYHHIGQLDSHQYGTDYCRRHFIAYSSCPCYSYQFMLIQRCSFCIFSICLNVASIDKEGVQANGKLLKELCLYYHTAVLTDFFTGAPVIQQDACTCM